MGKLAMLGLVRATVRVSATVETRVELNVPVELVFPLGVAKPDWATA